MVYLHWGMTYLGCRLFMYGLFSSLMLTQSFLALYCQKFSLASNIQLICGWCFCKWWLFRAHVYLHWIADHACQGTLRTNILYIMYKWNPLGVDVFRGGSPILHELGGGPPIEWQVHVPTEEVTLTNDTLIGGGVPNSRNQIPTGGYRAHVYLRWIADQVCQGTLPPNIKFSQLYKWSPLGG